MWSSAVDTLSHIWEQIEDLDYDYLKWVLWVLYPIIISFLLPLMVGMFLYCSALFLHVYQYRHRLRAAYAQDFWGGAKKTLCSIWVGQARLWHGYEIHGFDNIPDTGAAMIVYYHGVVPIDFYYVMASCIVDKHRQIHAIGDNFMFRIPGWRLLMEVFCVMPGTIQSCVDILKNGHLLAIAPGGVREALFGDEHYQVMWGKRTGFAKVALQTNVPIIPMFTQNVREAFRTPAWGRNSLRWVYEKYRLPIVPMYGFFPVKLRTFIGEPIHPDPNMSVEDLSLKIQQAIEGMINKHQKRPGNILRALCERISWKEKIS